jgi:hypothetical protein
MVGISKEDLIAETAEFLGGNPANFSLDRLLQIITITQHATDVLLNEIERRGELAFSDGEPILPYMSEHSVETILTRSLGKDVQH